MAKQYGIKIVKPIALLLIFIATSNFAQAQLSLSLQDAVDSAMSRNPEIKQYQSSLEKRQYVNKSSSGAFLPKVNLVGGYSYFSQNTEVNMGLMKESVDHIAGVYGAVIAKDLGLSPGSQEEIYNTIVSGLEKLPAENIVIDQQSYPNLSVNILQPIFTGGKLMAQKKFNQTGLDFAQIELEIAEDKVQSLVTDYYLKALLLTEVVETRKLIYKDLKKHEENVRKSIDAGILPPHEELHVKILVANADRDLKNDSSRLEMTLLSLKLEMGFDKNTPLVLTDSLVYKPIIVDLQSLEDNVENTQTVFKILDTRVALIEQKETLHKSAFMPDIGAYANFSFFRNEYPVIMPPAIVGIQFKWNLFNGFTDYNKTKSSKYAYSEIEYARTNADKDIKLWMSKSYAEAENFNRQYLNALPTEKLAKKNLEIMHKRFTEGLGTSINVLDAETLYTSAVTERQMSLYLYYTALNQLYMAAGEPEIFIELLSK